MSFIIIGLAILLGLAITFVVAGILVNKRNMKKDKYDLLKYLKKHQDSLSITLKEDRQETLAINSEKSFPLASTMKIIITYNFVKRVTDGSLSTTEKVKLEELDKYYIKNTDGNAHPNWKKSLNHPSEASLLEVAKGMMQFSSNACTDFLINKIGLDFINKSIEELKLDHDKITYLTSPLLIPAYLSDKAALAKLDGESYRKLSKELFEQMKQGEAEELKEKALKGLTDKTQLLITKKMPTSTTRDYAYLIFKLGKELFTKKEKELFSTIVIGDVLKSDGDTYYWYKGGATLFVVTSALYKETKNNTISVSVFLEDDTGGELYWIRNIFNDFVISIAEDVEFREKVKKSIV